MRSALADPLVTKLEATVPADPSAAEPADEALAERIRAGDGEAFELLFRRYYGRLHAFAVSLTRSPDSAEDIAVDVFARIWERRADWSVHASVRSYLFTAVRNEAIASLRRQRMVEPAAADADLHARELAAALDEAIDQLPERSREALLLHRKHGLSYAEVAETMGISARTVEVHIRRAFKALRISLGGFALLLLCLFL
jgi:RNA polymerase sigma-70 factor, ECF subfamily